MVKNMATLDDIYDRAIHVFLTMARNQFFWDVNKRMRNVSTSFEPAF